MKKIYVLASAVVFTSSLLAQDMQKGKFDAFPSNGEYTTNSGKKITKKAPGDVFWYEDFANGLAGNGVDGAGNPAAPLSGDIFWTRGYTGANDYSSTWKHDFNGPQGQYEGDGPFESESASNGWMLFDANLETDNSGQSFIDIDGYLESPSIDISAFGTTALSFEVQQSYRTCCSGSAYPIDIFVGYYDNGSGAWVWTQKSSGNNSHNQYPAGQSTTGYLPETRALNVTDVATLAAANTNEIRIRFHWNSDLNASNSYYFWMVDDIRVKEIAAYDSELVTMFTGDIINDFEYYMIPDGQIDSYTTIVGGDISNMGAANLTDVNLDVTISNTGGTVYTGNSAVENLAAGAETEIWFDTGFIPTAGDYGVYTVDITSAHVEADQNTSNNSLSKTFAYTEFEFGHYNNESADLGFDVVNSSSNPGRVMSGYGIYADATVYGIVILLEDGGTSTSDNTIGQTAAIGIYDGADGVTELAYQEFEVTSNMIGQPVSIMFDTPFDVFSGDFVYASLKAFGGGDVLTVGKDYDGDFDNSALIDINGTIYGDSGDHYVNLWFSNVPMTIGTNDITLNLSSLTAVPNPAANSTEVRYSIATSSANVSIEVVDVTGKVVMNETIGTQVAGNHTFELNTSNLSDGIYYYTLVAGQDRLTNKLVVRK